MTANSPDPLTQILNGRARWEDVIADHVDRMHRALEADQRDERT